MSQPRLDFVTCVSPSGMHRQAYWEWGDPANDHVLLCAHGLTRTGRDFDNLASALANDYRVVCPDVVGRGASDWLLNPSFYTVPQYVADMVTLLARVQPRTLHWVGTSMGGLIGMVLAGSACLTSRARSLQAHRGANALRGSGLRVGKLVLNDVGPRLQPDALSRIGQYVGQALEFATFDDAVAYLQRISAEFGTHTEAQWRDLARHVFRQQGDRWVKHYDLALAAPFALQDEAALATGEQLLWHSYDAIDCPILVMRGARSDLLSADTAVEMARRNPHARLLEVPNVGHAPTLMNDDQVGPVMRFLREPG